MCHASLKTAFLLHEEGLVKTTVPITVVHQYHLYLLNFSYVTNFENLCKKLATAEFRILWGKMLDFTIDMPQ